MARWGIFLALIFAGSVAEALTLTAVHSRKLHGAASHDITIDTTQSIGGAVTVEPRAIGTTGHHIVFQFDTAINSGAVGTASALDETGAPIGASASIGGSNEVVVTLFNMPDRKRVTVSLSNVNGIGVNAVVSLGFLLGDASNSGSVLPNDVSQAKARSGQLADVANYRFDFNTTGVITAADISAVKGRLNRTLPSVGSIGLPPDPSTVASPIDPTVATEFAAATAFLYTGPNPIQTGVAPGTIDARRVAVLRGKVQTREGAAISGVTIAILAHPEFGQTLTRADGAFDMAVNGGSPLTVNYRKTGFLPVQRAVVPPWREYTRLPDVAMVPFDSVVTPVNLNAASMQAARGSVVNDVDGMRQATILFPQNTTASMLLANGTTQPLTTLNVRATEYTVGASGPTAMPAALPPNSGYTYAAEFSVDEAVAAGATSVLFSQALPVYVDNFLNFPVGATVPSGYYDKQQGQWITSANGRVIKILSISGGLAALDTDGDALADDATKLAALNITDAERTRLALLYAAGKTLWRVPIAHFSTWDMNWGFGPPPDAVAPPKPVPKEPLVKDPCKLKGSVIRCEDQSLGESVPVTGTGWRLHYQSDRTPGRKDAFTLNIPVSGPTIPASLLGMHVEVSIAGRFYQADFAPTTNVTYSVPWDGKDAYGRTLQGAQNAWVRIGYTYGGVYQQTEQFGYNGNGALISGNMARTEVTLWTEYAIPAVGSWDQRALGFGGWSLNIHHAYDPASRTLLLGDGRLRRADALGTAVITTVAGNGFPGYGGDGGQAVNAQMLVLFGVAAGPDGSFYIADTGNNRVRRVGANGIITTVAGNGIDGFSGDGGPAAAAQVSNISNLAVGPDGSLYFADAGNDRVRRVDPSGIITTVAGSAFVCCSIGDGGPAVAAQLSVPTAVAIGPDGSLYIADSGNNRIRRVGADGIISTVAGNGVNGFSGDGGPAVAAQLGSLFGVAVGQDGSVFIADTANNNRIRRVGTDGIITTVAGNGEFGPAGDGGPAVAAQLGYAYGIAVGPDGSLYIADFGNDSIRRVGTDGIINTVAGRSPGDFSGDGGPATAAQLYQPFAVAVGPDGSLLIADSGNNRIRRVASAISGFSTTDVLMPSEDGREIYVFNNVGRHLRTLDALTSATLYQFTYNTGGYLISITDGSGNIANVERSGAVATAIVAPGGQRTTLTVNASGWLSGVSNPASEAHAMSYGTNGLMEGFTDPRGNIHTMTYDATGRLTKDQDPAGGSTSLARTDQSNGYTVTTTTALGRTRRYQVEQLPTGTVRRTVTAPSGAKTVMLIGADGSETTTYADGGIVAIQYGPDPRWGMLAPVPASVTMSTPGGLTRNITTTRTATLSNPVNLLSLTSLSDTVTDNGAVSTRTYNGTTRVFTTTTAAGRSATISVDALGRVTQEKTAALAPVGYAYDSSGQLTTVTEGAGTTSRSTTLTYNASRDLTGVADPLGRTTSYAYDAAGRLITRTIPGARILQTTYDAAGNATAITPPGKPAHAFAYTPIDLLSSYTPPDAGIGNTATLYAYNTERAPTQLTRPDGQIIDVTYDAAGRTSTIAFSSGLLSYTYSPTTAMLTGITAPGSIGLSHSYDGELLTGVTWTGPVSGAITYTFDNNFRVTGETINAANSITYGYAADGLITSAGSLALTRSTQNGLLSATTLGNVTDSTIYNDIVDLTSYSAAYSGGGIYSASYTRDALSRITQKIETVEGATTTYGYAYDAAGRLSGATNGGVTVATYTYDSNGNRTGGPLAATYDAQDRLLTYGSAGYTHSADGNRLSNTGGTQNATYQYDGLGNLVAATVPGKAIEYLIDGNNRRIGKKVNGTLVQGFLYQGQLHPVAELDGANAVVSRFVYATRRNVPDYMIKSGVTYRIIADHLGSPRLVVNVATGIVAQRMDYDVFGQVLNDTAPGFQPFGFAGGLYDRDLKLARFGARDYDPETGRWTAKDSLAFAGEDSNLYGYAINDPVNVFDSDGQDGVAVGGTLFIQSKDTKLLKDAKYTSEVIKTLQPGDEVTWLGKDPLTGLEKVERNGCKGYIEKSNLTPKKPSKVNTSDGKAIDGKALASSGAATKG